MEISSQLIKDAVAAAIRIPFPEANIYFDTATTPIYPCFFIGMQEQGTERIGKNLYRFSFRVAIEYRISGDSTRVSGLNEQLWAVGDGLCTGLQGLTIGGSRRPSEKVEIGIFENTIRAFLSLKLTGSLPEEPVTKMEEIQIKEELS